MLIEKKGDNNHFFNYKNYKFVNSEYFNYLENIVRKLSENKLLVPEILSFFDDHCNENGFWEV